MAGHERAADAVTTKERLLSPPEVVTKQFPSTSVLLSSGCSENVSMCHNETDMVMLYSADLSMNFTCNLLLLIQNVRK